MDATATKQGTTPTGLGPNTTKSRGTKTKDKKSRKNDKAKAKLDSISNNSKTNGRGVGTKRLHGDTEPASQEKKLTSNGEGSKKRGKDELFEFAAYPDKVFRKQGYHCCSLAEVAEYLDPSEAVVFLSKRQLPRESKKVKVAVTDSKSIEPEKKSKCDRRRFEVQFVNGSFNSTTKNDKEVPTKTRNGIWSHLNHLYSTNLKETLKSEMNDGDEDEYFGPTELIASVLDDKESIHILVTAFESGENEKSPGSPVPIAAVSFRSKPGEASNSLMIGACAVSNGKFTKRFGAAADDKSWRGRGLFSFLLMAARKLHRSIHRRIGELWCYVALRHNYTCLPVFQKLGFTPVAHNFKDCFGVASVSELSRLQYIVTNKRPKEPVFVPFVAEGTIYGCAGKFVVTSRVIIKLSWTSVLTDFYSAFLF